MTTWSHAAILETLARLRLACDALQIEPDDVDLDDLHPEARAELLRLAERDLWQLMMDPAAGSSPITSAALRLRLARSTTPNPPTKDTAA